MNKNVIPFPERSDPTNAPEIGMAKVYYHPNHPDVAHIDVEPQHETDPVDEAPSEVPVAGFMGLADAAIRTAKAAQTKRQEKIDKQAQKHADAVLDQVIRDSHEKWVNRPNSADEFGVPKDSTK